MSYNRELEELREENEKLEELLSEEKRRSINLKNKNISLKKLNEKLKRKVKYLKDHLNELLDDDDSNIVQEINNELSSVVNPYKTKHISTDDITNVSRDICRLLDIYFEEDKIQSYIMTINDKNKGRRCCFKIILQIESKKEVIYLEL